MVGDFFLSNRPGHTHFFEAGIAAFFVAHLGYLRYALLNGKLHRLALAILLAGFGSYFGLALAPAISDRVLWVASLLYLLISCVGFAAALGLKQPPRVKGLYVAGIGLVVFSDTVISFSEFCTTATLMVGFSPPTISRISQSRLRSCSDRIRAGCVKFRLEVKWQVCSTRKDQDNG